MSSSRLRSRTRRFERALWLVLGLVIAGSAWLFASSLGQTDGKAIRSLLEQPWFWRSAWLSVFTATITTLVAMLVGIPTAYALSRFRFRGRAAAQVLLDSVLVVPASTVGLVLMVAFQYPPVLALQDALGFRVVHSVASIVLAQLVLALAFGIQAWRAAFDSLNPRYEHVARSLGGSRLRTFFTVTIPLAKSGILAGIVLAWTRALAEFGAVLLLSGTFRMRDAAQFSGLSRWLGISNADVLSVGMWMEIEGGRTERGVALAFTLVLVAGLSVYLLHRLGDSRRSWVHS
ncbi:MAG: ABC transporter permease subunit [Deltaproteobacteria bacterium]|jgi:ABC-type sulfate transport system permease component|nr:ABC transporter permease subunit [Deltaproteobacteria bacterium]